MSISEVPTNNILELLKAEKLAEGLQETELIEIASYCELLSFEAGSLIFDENERSYDLYIIMDGEVLLLKTEGGSKRQFPIGRLGKGEIFGEMSFIDDSPRSSTVKANQELTLIKLSRAKFDDAPPNIRDIYNRIARNTAKIIIQRLKNANETFLKHKRKERYDSIVFTEFGKVVLRLILYMQVIGGLCGLIYLLKLAGAYFPLVNDIALLAMLMPIYRFIRIYKYPTNLLGLTWVGWQRSLARGILIGGFSITLVAVGIFLMQFLDWKHFFSDMPSPPLYYLFTYPLYVLGAEFLFRGVMLTLMEKFLSTSSSWSAITYIAVAVASTNFYFGLPTVFFVFVLNFLCGCIYLSDRNLLAVSIVHFSLVLLLKFAYLLPAGNFI